MKPVFNPETLNAWKEIDSAGWQKVTGELIDIFFNNSAAQFEGLKASWNSGDHRRMREIAHSLKSSCGNVGAEEAHRLLNLIEHSAAMALDELDAHLQKLEGVFARTLTELKSYRE